MKRRKMAPALTAEERTEQVGYYEDEVNRYCIDEGKMVICFCMTEDTNYCKRVIECNLFNNGYKLKNNGN